MKKLLQPSKSAFTLIEILIVLGISAMIAAASYLIYSKIRTNNMAQQEVTNLNILRSNSQALFANSLNYRGFNSENLVNSGLLPKNIKTDNNVIYNIYDKPYRMDAYFYLVNKTAVKMFMIDTTVPKSACETVVQGLRGWDGLTVVPEGGTGKTVIQQSPNHLENGKFNATAALEGCNGGTGEFVMIRALSR